MTSALQNRLVGTIIVVALVVIFVPEFLDGEKTTNQQAFVEVPQVTQLVEVQAAKPIDTSVITKELERPIQTSDDMPVDVDEQKDSESVELTTPNDSVDVTNESVSVSENIQVDDNEQSQSEVSSTKSAPTQVEIESTESRPISKSVNLDDIQLEDTGWVVQLGSFQHEKNVKSLLKTLNDAGYRVYTRPVTNSAGILLTKVFIGPELDKQKLENALPHLFEITNLKGKITPFEVSAN